MSVLDDFRAAEQRVAQRLKELEPAVAEYRELEAVAKQLGIDTAAVTAASAPPAPARRPSRRRRARATAAKPSTTVAKPSTTAAKATAARGSSAGSSPRRPSGGRQEQLLELVRARPGITVREAGTELGVDPTSLYRVVRRLEKSGQARKTGRALEPVAP